MSSSNPQLQAVSLIGKKDSMSEVYWLHLAWYTCHDHSIVLAGKNKHHLFTV